MNKISIKIDVSEDFMNDLADRIRERSAVDSVNRVYTLGQLERKLGLTKQTLRVYCREGTIKATKSGKSWLVAEQDLYNYLNQKK